jgi:hypothetical protein
MCVALYHFYIKTASAVSNFNALDLCSGDAGFESWPGHQLFGYRGFLRPFKQMRG